MVVEKFKNHDPLPVYRRFRERGRIAPEGLRYINSWVDENLACCFQLMESEDRALLEEWMNHWRDITDFEVFPVLTSEEAAARVSSKL
jgi:hypothetical protein